MEDLTGKQLGRYQIVAPLGEGGMAVVYKAYQPSMERYIAIKILPRHYAADPNFVGRFEQEAKVIASLQHPNILPVHDYGEADGYTYIVMRYIEGGTLADLLQGQPFSLPKICHIISQIGDALDYAHSRGVVHRDVKPSNVLIDERGNCLLTDFGMAKIIEATVQFTVSGSFVGTPTYASPEQCLGHDLDGRSDIYSLGAVLYEMATGHPPFEAEMPMEVVVKHIRDPLPPPRTINPTLPEAVERVILKALAKKPEDRYQTAGEMVRALAAVLVGLFVGGIKPFGIALRVPPTPTNTPTLVPPAATPTPTNTPTLVPPTATPTGITPPGPAPVSTATPTATPTATLSAVPPTGTPIVSPAPRVTPMPVQEYALPLTEPFDLVHDGSDLYALFQYRLVKLELLEAEGRFRAAEQQPDFSPANSLAWDVSRGEYWAVRGAPWWVGEEIDLIDRSGNRTATFTVPQTFVGYPRFIAWDGECLWVTSNEGPLYKVQPAGASGELRVIDSYAPSTGRFPNREATGLTWDGNHLWLLVDDILSRLNEVAQPICKIELSSGYPQPSWGGWLGLAWDGQFLWVAHEGANKVYRVDPAACR